MGTKTGTSNKINISKARLNQALDVIAFIQFPLGPYTGKVYYTSILKVTDMVFGGFYYDSQYYASICLGTTLKSDGSLDLFIQGNWSKVVYEGKSLSLDVSSIEVWYRGILV